MREPSDVLVAAGPRRDDRLPILPRRDALLALGQVGLGALTLPALLAGQRQASSGPNLVRTRAKSCIFIFLSGGPSHLETFDPKPTAPIDIRGPYGTIPTCVPGIQISELLPVPGIEVVGPLPAELQKITVFSAGIFAGAKEADVARALVTALTSAAARDVYVRKGMEPVS